MVFELYSSYKKNGHAIRILFLAIEPFYFHRHMFISDCSISAFTGKEEYALPGFARLSDLSHENIASVMQGHLQQVFQWTAAGDAGSPLSCFLFWVINFRHRRKMSTIGPNFRRADF